MKNRQRTRGFGLVELLVGMVIGMVTLLVVTQVMQSFEGQKRTSTGGNDAQTNGAFALYLMDREIRMAGYGLVGPEGLLCKKGINTYYDDSAGGVPIVVAGNAILPIQIVDGGGDSPDRLLIASSESMFGAIPTAFVDKVKPIPSAVLNVGSPGGLKDNDLFVMASRTGDKMCTLMQMTDDPKPTGSGYNLIHNPGKDGPYNPPNPEKDFGENAELYEIGDVVVNMGGGRPFLMGYSVYCDNLAEFEPLKFAPSDELQCDDVNPLVSSIVNLQAVYGVDSNGDGKVGDDEWKSATGDWETIDDAEISQIRAIRFAVVARSPQYEKGLVWNESEELWEDGPVVSFSEQERHYRYKVFETIVPLRNTIWSAS